MDKNTLDAIILIRNLASDYMSSTDFGEEEQMALCVVDDYIDEHTPKLTRSERAVMVRDALCYTMNTYTEQELYDMDDYELRQHMHQLEN